MVKSTSTTLSFQISFGAGNVGQIDEAGKVIRGMSLITGDLEAEGHNLHVDDTTLDQVFQYAKRLGRVTVKADHKGADGKTFKAIVGYLENFTKDTVAKKVRGDLHLLEAEELTPKILEMAKRMPENFGLSVAFKGKGETRGRSGRQFARCEKLLSADLVENPAANPDGAFSSIVDTRGNGMADPTNPTAQPNEEPTLADVLNAVNGLSQRIDAIETHQQQLAELLEDNGPLTQEEIEQLTGMTDEQLEQLGLTRAEVEAAVAEATGGIDAGATGPEPGNGGEGAGAGATAGAGASLSAGQQALREVRQLTANLQRQARAAEAAEEEHAFAVIEEKVSALAEVNEQQTQELAAKNAEIAALRTTLKTSGARNVPASVEGVTEFSRKSGEEGTFENIVTKEFQRLMKQPNANEGKAKSQAIDFAVRRAPGAYREWRERGGTIELSAR